MSSNNGHPEGNGDGRQGQVEDEGKLTLMNEPDRGVRTKLPVPQPDGSDVNLWSFLKTCIGKELSKITMPVEWNEPISLLQRFCEQMTYASLLNQVASSDPITRIQWVAAFAVSSISPNLGRMSKPFNPLLGETYQMSTGDFRVVYEQVGHHPPVSAFHAEGRGPVPYTYRGSVCPKTKFWGKSVEFTPQGTLQLQLPGYDDEIYTWNLPKCVVHNVIIGKLWMEQVGTMVITNQKTKHKCSLSFRSSANKGWLSNSATAAEDMHTVEGYITDPGGKKVKFLYGKWTEHLASSDAETANDFLGVGNPDKIEADASNLPSHPTLLMGAVPNSSILWQAVQTPSENTESYYNFSSFAMALNQRLPIEQQESLICTDSRLRPDIRALEEGELEMAAAEKERLENKQRDHRKPYGKKSESEWWTPRWFAPVKNEYSKQEDWKFVGNYWDSSGDHQNDKSIPDIF